MVLKGFNLDLHVAVIKDVMTNFKEIYGSNVEITSWSISGHKEMFNLGPDHVDIINQETWFNIDEAMIEAFNSRYGWFLAQFDFFVVTHSPVFSMIYERYNKPIIIVNSCRYNLPYCWTKKSHNFNAALTRMVEKKILIIISNNINDAIYMKSRANIDSIVIPSLCRYIGKHNPLLDSAIVFGNRKLFPNGDWLHEKPKNYSYSDVLSYKCIVHVPYEASTMSIFEHFWSGAPLFFPTKEFYKACILDNTMEFIHFYGEELTEERFDNAMKYADFYIFPYINYYNSYSECKTLVENFVDINRAQRLEWLETNKKNVLDSWRKILPAPFHALETLLEQPT